MEALVALSEGSPGLRSVGVGEYVNEFFDVIDDDVHGTGESGRALRRLKWRRSTKCTCC